MQSNLKKLKQQIEFIAEVDGLKSVLRKTSPIGETRRENSAEHSWQVVLTAILLAEHANDSIDLLKVVKMLAIHDVVEIDTGDTMHYEKVDSLEFYEHEQKAAKRIFALLPEEQQSEYLHLWEEFEKKASPEARFAAAVDRLMAFIMNAKNAGGTWKEYGLKASQVVDKNKHAAEGAELIWEYMQVVIDEAVSKEFLLDL